jgi:flagellar hook assembly protein FlgD
VVNLQLAAGSPAELQILDVAGRTVRTFSLPSSRAPRSYSLIWDGTDDAGKPVPPGCYLARWNSGKRYQQTRLTLLR